MKSKQKHQSVVRLLRQHLIIEELEEAIEDFFDKDEYAEVAQVLESIDELEARVKEKLVKIEY